jgi:hypothetical protein
MYSILRQCVAFYGNVGDFMLMFSILCQCIAFYDNV